MPDRLPEKEIIRKRNNNEDNKEYPSDYVRVEIFVVYEETEKKLMPGRQEVQRGIKSKIY